MEQEPQSANKLGNHAELDQVVGVDVRQRFGHAEIGVRFGILSEADRPLAEPFADDVVDASKRAAADE